MSEENAWRERIARFGRSLFERRLTMGSSGNISVRLDDGWLMTPTGWALGDLDPAAISKLDAEGNHLSGDKPTKETFLHLGMYRHREDARAVVHLHSTHSVAVSCLADIDALLGPGAFHQQVEHTSVVGRVEVPGGIRVEIPGVLPDPVEEVGRGVEAQRRGGTRKRDRLGDPRPRIASVH